MKKLIAIFSIFSSLLLSQTMQPVNDLSGLFMLSNSRSRSISPENLGGEKGRGGMATLKEGSAAHAAQELGQGWKVNPYVRIQPGETFVMADIKGSGVINHIWMTPTGDYRLTIFRMYWDGEEQPSVETPVGDFFCSGWGWGNEPQINSLAICVNPQNGFNSYWQMPFRKGAKITMENRSPQEVILYYQIDYSETEIPADAAYFHAQFRRVNPVKYKDVYTIVDGIKGKGHYVGTYLAHGANTAGWWGEGEIKFYMDGDTDFPTICGTGEEDYFNGSYGYEMRRENGQDAFTDFSTPYSGFHYVRDPKLRLDQRRFGQYRWHITDPVRFEKDLRVTIQDLGWKSGGIYLALQDDMASVAYWYQTEPHNPFPALPKNEDLILTFAEPVEHLAKGKAVTLLTRPSPRYNPNPATLVDGKLGSNLFNDGFWMGFQQTDAQAVIDLGQVMTVSALSTNFLSDQDSWIFLPRSVQFYVSTDGQDYRALPELTTDITPRGEKFIETFSPQFGPLQARYIKLVAGNTGTCPQWHKGAGGQAWIFVDEIVVK